jgi:AcrR family transcriptional regulator
MTASTPQPREGDIPATSRPRPRGQPTVPSEAHRLRILSAMAQLAAEDGIHATTVARVITSARVSRRTFYLLFEDRYDCLCAAFEQAVALAAQRASAAYASEVAWQSRVRAGIFALLEFFDEEPELARLCIVQAVAGGPATLASRARVLERLSRVVHEDGTAARARRPPPLVVAEGVVGGSLSVIHSRLLQGRPVSLIDLLSPLTALVVLPYLGAAAVRRELLRVDPPRSAPAAHPREHQPNPLETLEMRLTYRTVRVLSVIAVERGLSNAAVSDRAGIVDQGQVSKLLTRIARLGLVENRGEGQVKGAANAWHLTPLGEELERAASGQLLGRP